jgi:uncharacterized repeat protein (TIGR04042 family)
MDPASAGETSHTANRGDLKTVPETHFHLRWPDGRETRCYSPSLVVREHLQPGQAYPLPEFLHRARSGLHAASERVRIRHGHPCAAALDQWHQIEAAAGAFQDRAGARVEVVRFEPE